MTTFSFTLKKLYHGAAAAIIILAAAACNNEDDWSPYVSQARLENDEVSASQPSVTITTHGDPKKLFAAQIIEGGDWCSFNSTTQQHTITGKMGENLTVYLQYNASKSSRTAKVEMRLDGQSKILSFRQLGVSDNADYERSWGEQPHYNDGDDFIYKTYYTTLNDGRRVRNYSICYDYDKLVSQWVAYPLHDVYLGPSDYEGGGSKRTDVWAFDDAVSKYNSQTGGYSITSKYLSDLDTYNTYTNPIIPQRMQQNIIKGAYNDNPQGVRNLNRGHMLPAASRYNTWMTNAQTFYATNMMPQNGSFNSGSWAKIEGGARSNVCKDTLYVVTGTIFDSGYVTLTTRDRRVAMPTHAYKLLLRTKNGNTGKKISDITSADEIISIGFVFENSEDSKNTTPAQAAVSVSEIERRTGFKFFRLLNPDIADAVKSQCNLNDWAEFR